MSDRIPISWARLLDELNEAELREGYQDGYDGESEPGNNRSFSYWHGWRNGAVDGGHRSGDEAQMALARDVIDTGYLARMRLQDEDR
ncbi:MAG: hypothetical protein P4L85_14120 [Paludisphaera borealis]|uniref:hypothetical protein n=1 Tax=Paludisphaera borealis TaxID=1387353 RepID=UPI00284A2B78|nr:hypothetical protein [Paludisphaera borealis]MDR3620483.1 hypothetical protein [Paludisphaera borealis]